jgi:hypothetical protein
VILIRTITTGSDWHCEPDAQDAIIEVTPNSRDSITFSLCWSDVRVIADRLLQALTDAGEAIPVEHIDTFRLPPTLQRRADWEDAIGARLNGDDGPDAA